jgi:hypothetical protein
MVAGGAWGCHAPPCFILSTGLFSWIIQPLFLTKCYQCFKWCGMVWRKDRALCGAVGGSQWIPAMRNINLSSVTHDSHLPQPITHHYPLCTMPSSKKSYSLLGNLSWHRNSQHNKYVLSEAVTCVPRESCKNVWSTRYGGVYLSCQNWGGWGRELQASLGYITSLCLKKQNKKAKKQNKGLWNNGLHLWKEWIHWFIHLLNI